jgi:hypothetical protein
MLRAARKLRNSVGKEAETQDQAERDERPRFVDAEVETFHGGECAAGPLAGYT